MDKTRDELITICKERGIKGYSGKKKAELVELIGLKEKQDTGKFRKNTKDQFYTKPSIAANCIARIIECVPAMKDYLWLEPAAGNGAFLHNIPDGYERLGLDIDPGAADIERQDYLKWKVPKAQANKKIIVVGNPPFGRQSSLAKAFIAKSCGFAQVIAFILPKSFTKPSMYCAFDLKFHLLHSNDLPRDSFLLNGEAYDVPCVFQIWVRRDSNREVVAKVDPCGFQYVKGDYDIAFRRVGALAGRCYRNDGTAFSAQSHYFIKFDCSAHVSDIIAKINAHEFPSNTVGPRSLSKSEVNVVINRIIESV